MNNLLEYATTRAKLLFGCYRRGDANDPDTYVAAIAAVLCGYDSELIRDVTDPRIGICSDEKFATFPPNVGELKRYCEAKAAHRDHLKRLGSRRQPISAERLLAAPDPRDAPDGCWANVHIPSTNGRYAAIVEWSKTADRRKWKFGKSSVGVDGIWIAHDVWWRELGTDRNLKRVGSEL